MFTLFSIPRLLVAVVLVFTILQLWQFSQFSKLSQSADFLWLWSWSSPSPGFLSTWSTSSLILESTRNSGWTLFVWYCFQTIIPFYVNIVFRLLFHNFFSFQVNINRNLFKILFLGFPLEMWQAGRAYIQNSPKKHWKKIPQKSGKSVVEYLPSCEGCVCWDPSSSVSNPVIYGFFNSVRLLILGAVFFRRQLFFLNKRQF